MSLATGTIKYTPSNVLRLFEGTWLKNPQAPEELYVPVNKPIERAYDAGELISLKADIVRLFSQARRELFEDGMDSAFSRGLIQVVEEHGETAVNQISLLIESGSIPPELLAECLRWLGNMDSGVAYERRRFLLEKCLFDSSTIVRDGAILGVSFLEDKRSIHALDKAWRAEIHDMLQADITQVINDLNSL